jgi:hypothetical protein
MATITLEVIPFYVYVPFPALVIFKCILEVAQPAILPRPPKLCQNAAGLSVLSSTIIPLAGLLLCLKVITVNAALVTSENPG